MSKAARRQAAASCCKLLRWVSCCCSAQLERASCCCCDCIGVRALVAPVRRRRHQWSTDGHVCQRIIVDVKHVSRNQRFHRSDPHPFFCCFREWLAPHVQHSNVQRRHRRHAAAPRSLPLCVRSGDASRFLTQHHQRMHASRSLLQSKKVLLQSKQKAHEEACRAPGSPRHCHARARCSAPCTRAHARRARSSRTRHACAAPCVRASPAMHMLTHACTSKSKM